MAMAQMNDTTRRTLQVFGPLLMVTGFILFGITFMSISSGGASTMPLGFIGVLLIGLGSFLSKFGFMKPVSEIVVTETEQAAAYGSRNIAKGVAEGLREGGFQSNVKIRCRNCGELDDEHAKFCSGCGQAM